MSVRRTHSQIRNPTWTRFPVCCYNHKITAVYPNQSGVRLVGYHLWPETLSTFDILIFLTSESKRPGYLIEYDLGGTRVPTRVDLGGTRVPTRVDLRGTRVSTRVWRWGYPGIYPRWPWGYPGTYASMTLGVLGYLPEYDLWGTPVSTRVWPWGYPGTWASMTVGVRGYLREYDRNS